MQPVLSILMSSKARMSGFPNSFGHTTRQQGRKFVIGLLSATDFNHAGDLQMVTDFVFLRKLIGARDDKSLWLSGAPLPDEDYILGDPACDRIAFQPPAFITWEDSPNKLLARFLLQVKARADQLVAKETLVLVLCGHGSHDRLMLGNSSVDRISCDLSKSQLEMCFRHTKGTIWVINTACHAGSWESPYWSLLVAAEAHQSPISIARSDKVQGGFFTAPFIAEYAQEFEPDAPQPSSVNTQGVRRLQLSHNSAADAKKKPVCASLTQMLRFARRWIQIWKSRIACPRSRRDNPHKMPFHLPDSYSHHFRCIPPSPLTTTVFQPTTANPPPTAVSPTQQEPPLSLADEAVLMYLARKYLQTEPVTNPKNIPTILKCLAVVHASPLTNTAKLWLLSELRDRQHRHKLAIAIAVELDWTTGAASAAGLEKKEYKLYMLDEAEAAGCVLTAVYGRGRSYRKYVDAACWLAHAWDAEGRPNVDPTVWQSAVAQATVYVQNGPGIHFDFDF